jgi:hypothetical protein
LRCCGRLVVILLKLCSILWFGFWCETSHVLKGLEKCVKNVHFLNKQRCSLKTTYVSKYISKGTSADKDDRSDYQNYNQRHKNVCVLGRGLEQWSEHLPNEIANDPTHLRLDYYFNQSHPVRYTRTYAPMRFCLLMCKVARPAILANLNSCNKHFRNFWQLWCFSTINLPFLSSRNNK